MAYVVYEVESTRIATLKPYGKEHYATAGAAKAARTRMEKSKRWVGKELAVAEISYYAKNIEKMVKRVNLMSGKEYWESVNTPNYLSPSSETYWSM